MEYENNKEKKPLEILGEFIFFVVFYCSALLALTYFFPPKKPTIEERVKELAGA